MTIAEEIGVGQGFEDANSNNDSIGVDETLNESQGNGLFDRFDLFCQTGEGSIESYLDKPLNFNNSKAVAQILRGVSGIFGQLDLAILDIGIGAYRLWKGDQ